MNHSWAVEGRLFQAPEKDCLGRHDDRELKEGGGGEGDQACQEVCQGGEHVSRPDLTLSESFCETPVWIKDHFELKPFISRSNFAWSYWLECHFPKMQVSCMKLGGGSNHSVCLRTKEMEPPGKISTGGMIARLGWTACRTWIWALNSEYYQSQSDVLNKTIIGCLRSSWFWMKWGLCVGGMYRPFPSGWHFYA